MLHGDLGGVFRLLDAQTHQSAQRGGGHGAGRADLCLTAAFRAGDGAVALDESAEQAGDGQRAQDLRIWDIVRSLHVQQHGGQHACGAAGRRGDDGAVVGVLFRNGKGIGTHDAQLAHLRALIFLALRIEALGLALHVQAARQRALGGQTVGNGLLHRLPDLREKVPDAGALVQLHIFAQRDVAPAAELRDLRKGIFGIDLILLLRRILPLDADVAAADGGHAHGGVGLAFAAGKEVQRVRVRQAVRRLLREDDLRPLAAEHFIQHAVRAVAAPRLGQRTVKHDTVGLRVGIFAQEKSGGALRPHGVGAGRPLADLINVADRFHPGSLHISVIPDIIAFCHGKNNPGHIRQGNKNREKPPQKVEKMPRSRIVISGNGTAVRACGALRGKARPPA